MQELYLTKKPRSSGAGDQLGGPGQSGGGDAGRGCGDGLVKTAYSTKAAKAFERLRP